MKKFFVFLFAVLLLVSSTVTVSAESEPTLPAVEPEITADAAVLFDAETKTVLYGKNLAEKHPSAAVSQILTVLLGLESGKTAQTVTVSQNAVESIARDTTHISLKAGEEVSLNDLLYAVMLSSAKDAAITVAEFVSGSEAAFVEKMNEKIAELGGTGSHFTNSRGESGDGNYTTAQDLAFLTAAALENPNFRALFGKTSYTMEKTNLNASTRSFVTLCLLLKNSDKNHRYDAAIGGKSGYDLDSGYTLAAAAEKDGRTLICVILGAKTSDSRYTEAISLFDYGFTAFRNVEVPTSLLPETEIPVMKDGVIVRKIKTSIPSGTKISTSLVYQEGTMSVSSELPAYVQEGESDLRLTISAKDPDGKAVLLGTVVLAIETKDIALDGMAGGEKNAVVTTGEKVGKIIKKVLLVVGIILGVILLIAGTLFLVSYTQRRRRRKKRLMRRETLRRREEDPPSPLTGKRHKKQ